jgi:hypothetical protein
MLLNPEPSLGSIREDKRSIQNFGALGDAVIWETEQDLDR